MTCPSAMQGGDKPAAAHNRTLELESPAEALGPAEKKRIVESRTTSGAAAAVAVKAERAQQNGFGAHPASSAPAETGGEAATGQAIKQEAVADNAKSAGAGGDVSMTDASAKAGSDANSSATQAGNKQSSAAPKGVTVKQEQHDDPGLQKSQQGRAATPELKIERLDARTGQVIYTHHGWSFYQSIAKRSCLTSDARCCLYGNYVLGAHLSAPAWQLIKLCKAFCTVADAALELVVLSPPSSAYFT